MEPRGKIYLDKRIYTGVYYRRAGNRQGEFGWGLEEDSVTKRMLISIMMLCSVVLASHFVPANGQPAETPLSELQAQATGRAVAENMPSVSDLLERYTQALDSTLSFIEHYERSTEFGYHVTTGARDKGISFERGQVRHDDQRVYCQQYKWGRFGGRDLPKDRPHYRCNIVDGKGGKSYQNNRMLKSPGSHGRASRDSEYLKNVNLGGHFGVSYIVGYVGSDERLDTILRKAYRISVRATTENVGGSECFVIDADTKCGHYTVWLDPEHGYHPARVTRKAGDSDYTHGRKFTDFPGFTAFTYLDNVRFEKVADIWVPMEAYAGCDRRFVEGYFNKADHHYKRTQIILNPDHEKLGSFADPIFEDPSNDPQLINGTPVTTDNIPIQYTWQDGKLIDENGMVADLDWLKDEGRKRLRRGGRK